VVQEVHGVVALGCLGVVRSRAGVEGFMQILEILGWDCSDDSKFFSLVLR